jgi:hypothetical protein
MPIKINFFSLFIIKLINTNAMANELKKLIREAFNTAYIKHKNKSLSESSDSMKAKMSSNDINKAEQAFREIKSNPNVIGGYAWTPQGSANGKLNQNQFNLLTELVFENTDLDFKKKVFMAMYSDKNPALVNTIKARLMGMKGSHVTEEDAMVAIETAWNEMFLGEKFKSGDQLKKGFMDAVKEYSPLDNSNFGAYLMRRIVNASSTALRDYYNLEKPVSLDAPSPVTGKATEFGSGEDFGSDSLNPIMDPGSDLTGLGAGFENPEANGAGDSEEYITVAGDEEAGDEENVSPDMTVGANIEDEGSPAQIEAKKMVSILVDSIREAVSDFRQYTNTTPAQQKGLSALEHIINTGESPDKDSANAILDLKKNRKFMNTIDRYLFENGFLNSRGKAESFQNIKIKYLAQLVQFLKTGDASVLSSDLQENKLWFIENMILENFTKNHLDKIMENVYKRLLPKLNN